MKVKEIVKVLNDFAPLIHQESYDNSGLILGDGEKTVTSALLSIDITNDVIDEAANLGCGLVISHHPLIFGGVKKLTGSSDTERAIINAIRRDISIYAGHTNFDNVYYGVNHQICKKLGLKETKILAPSKGALHKLVVFVPVEHANRVRSAIFEAGAGHIGDYDQCSYNIEGVGTFRGACGTSPFAGKAGTLHYEKEIRIETVYPKHLEKEIVKKMLEAHPYEEVAYDLYPLLNKYSSSGAGMTGLLEEPLAPFDFLDNLKNIFQLKVVRHTRPTSKIISKVAVCGGSGSFLIDYAIKQGADIFVSGDFKYHQLLDAEGEIMVADIGHFESEQFTVEIFNDLLIEKLPNFVVRLSKVNTNPINYY